MEPYDLIIEDLKEKTSKTVKHLRDQLASIRTGRASPALVDTMRVDYYGTPTPLDDEARGAEAGSSGTAASSGPRSSPS